MMRIAEQLQYSPLATASLIDKLLGSVYVNNGVITITDVELYNLLEPMGVTPQVAIRLLSRNKISVTNIHIRTKSGRSEGHKYIIDLNTIQDKPTVYKISRQNLPMISNILLSSTEGAN